ncbi:sensor histidine kinase [Zunongwangia endophytica]|uniref:Sensor histidine kinase n=1 Tax=Zunongwangia endophytica TaxID=1808945 RepID=A0ABV8HDF6_9FLAO|nr:histidine kinase [Zunongwangia endophytica]MDN3596893.1 histidine kinase [Zunongwangia endophytica]
MKERASSLVHQQWKPFFHWSAVLVSLGLANLIQYLLNPKSSWWDFYTEAKWIEILTTILVGVVIYAVLFGVVDLLSRYANKHLILRDNILVHFFATTLVVIGAMFFLLYVESFVYAIFWPETSESNPDLELRQYLVVNMIIAAFVNSFYHSYFFFENWKAKVIESKKLELHAHQLKENALQSQLEILKLQLDPHFLFNNFSILTQLIETNPKDAQEFLSNLSRVYRYILTTGKKDIIALEEELKFVEMYFHLIKIRHGKTMFLNININEADKRKGIPPVTLQLLLENAIKHNIATAKQPLYLTIESDQDASIIVKNNLQPINIDYKSTGMGLKNIKERYQLLQGKIPEIRKTHTSFEVQLPLLSL